MSEENEMNQGRQEGANNPYQGGYPQGYGSYYPHQPYAFYPMQAYRQMPPSGGQQFTGMQQQQNQQGMLPMQQSYIENILRLNRGKLATVHMTFEGNNQRTFTGIIEAAGRDHIILSEEGTGRRVLLLMVYLDYVTFNEEIEYDYPFYGSQQQLANYSPR